MLDKRIIEFFHNKALAMALVLRSDAKNLYCLTEDGVELKVPPDKALFDEAPAFDVKADNFTLVHHLKTLSQKRDQLKNSIDISDLWEICLDDSESYSLENLCAIYFGKDHGHEEKSALFRLLHDDRTYFTRKKDSYSPNPREHVENVTYQRKAEETRARNHEVVGANFKAILEGRTTSFIAEAEEYIAGLEDISIRKKDSPKFKEICSILQKAGVNSTNAPFTILVRSGLWSEDENLLLREYGIEKAFHEAVLAECESIITGTGLPAQDNGYSDCTALDVITIDDETTRDFDDALSIEERGEITRLGIHIADISFFVGSGSLLEQEARTRGTSIYMPDLKIQMLPPELSEDAASLREGEKRRALSFFVHIDQNGEVVDFSIEKTVIKVTRRATYNEVDSDISQDHPILKKLGDLAALFFARRLQQCSFHTPFPRLTVHLSPSGEIVIKKEEPSRPSQVLVSEMMILANSLAGKFCIDNSIPAIYRVQECPDNDMPKVDRFDLYTLSTLRKFLKKGVSSTTSSRHHGLGVEHYVQATSPLRRYSDLIMHRQLKHFLSRGAPLYSTDELAEIITLTDRASETADMLERDRKHYWILKYLEKLKGHELEAVIIRFYQEKMIVQLTETLCETDCLKPRGADLLPGDIILVVVELVWPREGIIRLSFQG